MTKKDIAQKFLSMVVGGQIQEAFDQHTGEPFVHHNQYTKPGKQELIAGMKGSHEHFPEKIFESHMAVEEGNLVMVYSSMKFTPDHKGLTVVHILRFENDKIVEMRDVIQQTADDAVNQ